MKGDVHGNSLEPAKPRGKGRSSVVVGMGGGQGRFPLLTILVFLPLSALQTGINARSGARLPSPIRVESLPMKSMRCSFCLPRAICGA